MKRIFFTIFLTVFTAVFGFAQFDFKTVATINLTKTESITGKQLRTEVERREKAAGRALNNDERLTVLDEMINERLVLQAAERDRITITENEVNNHLEQSKTQMSQAIGRKPTDAEFATAVKNQTGMELAVYRDQVRRQLVLNKYLTTKKKSIFDNVKNPSEDDIGNIYLMTKAQLVRPDTVRISMIQVPFGQEKTRAKNTADQLSREIGASPSKFDEVVLRGQAANSGFQAGDAGYLPRNMEAAQVFGQEFINTAFSLKQGEVSKVIEGRTGYQIFKVTETYSMKNLELNDIFQLGTRVTVKDYLGNTMYQQRQMEALKQAADELVAELRTGRTFNVLDKNLSW
ncbi:MAG: peptidylprolyl isomerase [Treponema sp.]|nr:peptidylprolyl isomerase [Treponema sp.]